MLRAAGELDTSNRFAVGGNGNRIWIGLPPRGPLTSEDALNLAAWIVALADPDREVFDRLLDAICET